MTYVNIDWNRVPANLNRDVLRQLQTIYQNGSGFSIDSPEARYLLDPANNMGNEAPPPPNDSSGNYVPATADTTFDDILREAGENLRITQNRTQENYNRFLEWAGQDKTIFEADLAKEYAKALTKNFSNSVAGGGVINSGRYTGDTNLLDAKTQKKAEFDRQQERDKQIATLNKSRADQDAARAYATSLRNMAYQPAFQQTY